MPLGCEPRGAGETSSNTEKESLVCSTGSDGYDPDAIFYFFDKDCPDCRFVQEHLLQPFVERLGLTLAHVEWYDITDPDAVRLLLSRERALQIRSETLAPVIIAGETVYAGLETIRQFLLR